jgi:hypothetical protein
MVSDFDDCKDAWNGLNMFDLLSSFEAASRV